MGQIAAFSAPAHASNSTTPGSVDTTMSGISSIMDEGLRHDPASGAGEAAAVLATGWQYVTQGERTVAQFDGQLSGRADRIERLKDAGAPADQIRFEQEQLDLFTKLRDRVAESVERVRKILAGKDGADDRVELERSREKRRIEELLLEESRRRALDIMRVPEVQPVAAAVAAAYGAGSTGMTR